MYISPSRKSKQGNVVHRSWGKRSDQHRSNKRCRWSFDKWTSRRDRVPSCLVDMLASEIWAMSHSALSVDWDRAQSGSNFSTVIGFIPHIAQWNQLGSRNSISIVLDPDWKSFVWHPSYLIICIREGKCCGVVDWFHLLPATKQKKKNGIILQQQNGTIGLHCWSDNLLLFSQFHRNHKTSSLNCNEAAQLYVAILPLSTLFLLS